MVRGDGAHSNAEQAFDPTEVVVSWKVLKRLGHSVVFATPACGPLTPPSEAVLRLFDSVDATVSTFRWISFACAQGRIETE